MLHYIYTDKVYRNILLELLLVPKTVFHFVFLPQKIEKWDITQILNFYFVHELFVNILDLSCFAVMTYPS